MFFYLSGLLFTLLLSIQFIHAYEIVQQEQLLHTNLLKRYNRFIRPLNKPNVTTVVNISVEFRELLHLNEDTGRVSLNSIITVKWRDAHLQWQPSDYNGLRKTHISLLKHWFPPMEFIMSRSSRQRCAALFEADVTTLLHHNGQMMRTSECILEMPCTRRKGASQYPHDSYQCILFTSYELYEPSEVHYNLHASFSDQSNKARLASGWKLQTVRVFSHMGLINNHIWPSMQIRIKLLRLGNVAFKIQSIIYPFGAFLTPLLFVFHPMAWPRLLFSLMLLGMSMHHALHCTFLPGMTWDPNATSLNLPPLFYLMRLLMTFQFLQLTWFFYAYHICVQLPANTKHIFSRFQYLTHNEVVSYFVGHYPRRNGPSSTTTQENSVESDNPGFLNEEREPIMNRDPEPIAQESSSANVAHERVCTSRAINRDPSVEFTNRANQRSQRRMYSDTQVICICVDILLLFLYFSVCILLVFDDFLKI